MTDLVRAHLDRGWNPIPVSYRSKNPAASGWQKLIVTPANRQEFFTGHRQNIGVLLGKPSGRLTDVDLDAPEALVLAPPFLPQTDCKFGRPSKPESHWLYICNPLYPTKRFKDVDGNMLVEGPSPIFLHSQAYLLYHVEPVDGTYPIAWKRAA
jgi:hypothetical protein